MHMEGEGGREREVKDDGQNSCLLLNEIKDSQYKDDRNRVYSSNAENEQMCISNLLSDSN